MRAARTMMGGPVALGMTALAILSATAIAFSKVEPPQHLRIHGHDYLIPSSADVTKVQLPDGRTLTIDGIHGSAMLTGKGQQKALSLPERRRYASVTLMPSGQVLIWGGVSADGRILDGGEWFEPSVDRFVWTGAIGLPARAGHTLTVLTNGKVLVSGGWDSSGALAGAPLLWDPLYRTTEGLPERGADRRALGRAELQADGSVVISGGLDEHSQAATYTWRFGKQPKQKIASGPTNGAAIVETLPGSNAAAASIHGPLAIQFASPMDVEQLAHGTVTLLGPEGLVQTQVVGVDGGRLAFVQLPDDLYPGSRYTLFLKGLHTQSGALLPFKAIGFTTEHAQSTGVVMAGQGHRPSYPRIKVDSSNAEALTLVAGDGHDVCRDPAHLCRPKSFIQEGAWYPGANNLPDATGGHWRLYRPRQSLPDTRTQEARLPRGTTALIGQVRRIDETPVANVEVSIGAVKARTDAQGVFVLQGIPDGHQPLFVDGRTASYGDVSYGRFLVGVDVQAKRTVRMPYVMYLPRVLPRDRISLPAPTDRETVLTHPDLPGLELHIPAGTVFKDRTGHVLTQIAIVPTPVDHAPFPLPDNFPMYFTIQPSDAVVQGLTPEAAKGIRVVYPNYGHVKPNVQGNFWVYSAQDGWQMYGEGHVTPDAGHLAPDPGVSLVWALGAGASFNNASPPGPQICDGMKAGDPIDLQTGAFTEETLDLSINDIFPLTLVRAYRSNDTVSHEFGTGATSGFGIHLYSRGDSLHPQLVMPCGEGIQYDLISGSVTWPFPAGTFWAHSATTSAFYGSTLEFLYDNTTDGAHWILSLKDGTQYAFTRHSPNALAWMQDRHGNRLQLNYSGGLLDQVESPSGRTISFNYDSANRISSATDNSGRTIRYSYDTVSGGLATITFPDQTTEKYTYDANKRLITIEDRRGIVATTNHYDADGRVDIQTYPDQSSYQFQYSKDASGSITATEVTDPNGHVERVAFDPVSRYPSSIVTAYGTSLAQKRVYVRDPSGLVTNYTDAMGRHTELTYDALGNVVKVTRLAGTTEAQSYYFTYTSDYSLLASTTDPLGHTKHFSYTKGCLTQITDALGHSTAIICNDAGQPSSITDALGHTTVLAYDGYDLRSVTDPLGRTTTYATDALGRRVASKDPLGNVFLSLYDDNNRITKTIDGLNQSSTMTYDGNGNLLSVELPNTGTVNYTYDSRNRLVQRIDALGQSESWAYDYMGDVVSHVDRKGQATLFSYDQLDRRILTSYADGSGTQASYDNGNRLTELLDTQSGSMTWGYDDLNQVIQSVTPKGAVSYSYDAAGRRARMTVSAQAAVTYDYDSADRLISLSQGSEKIQFAYDFANRRTTLTLPNGVVTAYAYDSANQLTRIAYAKPDGTTLGELDYAYAQAGQVANKTGTLNSDVLPNPTVQAAAFDLNNRIISYNGANFTYDANGNLTSDGVNVFTWNARNELVQISQGGVVRLNYTYDAQGRRISKQVGDDPAIAYLYDGSNPVQETQGDTVNPILTGLGVDERYARNDITGRTYFLTDLLGSTVALTNSASDIVQQYHYDPYGNDAGGSPNSTNRYKYSGREQDEPGLYYYRARYYSSVTGRFLSEDPLGFSGRQFNVYSYVNDDPVLYTDPYGQQVSGPRVPSSFSWRRPPGAGGPYGPVSPGVSAPGRFVPPEPPAGASPGAPPNEYTLLCFRAVCHTDRNYCSANTPGLRDEFFVGGYPTVSSYERSNPDCSCTRYAFPDQIQPPGPQTANAWDVIELYSKVLGSRIVP